MDFEFSPEQLKFAAEVERFLDEHDDPEVFDPTRENMAQIVDTPKRRAFMAELGRQGWLGITWPKEHGGQDGDGVFEFDGCQPSLALDAQIPQQLDMGGRTAKADTPDAPPLPHHPG